MKKQASNIVSANPFLKSEEEEAMAQQANRTKIFEIAAYQKSQREQKRNLEENQKKAEFDYYVKLNIDNSKELGRGKDIAAKKTFEFKESYGKELQNIIESKKIMMDKAKEEARMLDLENERFHQRKSYIAAKHKELTDSRSE
jgi:NADH dehydrogenase/NADH:ubiquinone oxidoreductase subunit G